MTLRTHFELGAIRVTTVKPGDAIVRLHVDTMGRQWAKFLSPGETERLIAGLRAGLAAVRDETNRRLAAENAGATATLLERLEGPPDIDRLLARHGQPRLPESSVEDLLPGSPKPESRRPKHAYEAPAPTHRRRAGYVAALRWAQDQNGARMISWLRDNGFQATYRDANGMDYSSTAYILVTLPSGEQLTVRRNNVVAIHPDRRIEVMQASEFELYYEVLPRS